MQGAKANRPKIQCLMRVIYADTAQDYFQKPQVANIRQGIFTGVNECQAVEHKAGGRDIIPTLVT